MCEMLTFYKKEFVEQFFVKDLDLNVQTINLSYILEHNITKESMQELNIDISKMLEIGGDSYARFEGYDNVKQLCKSLKITDLNNVNYDRNLKTIQVCMSNSFIDFCNHIKYAINNKIIARPKSTEL